MTFEKDVERLGEFAVVYRDFLNTGLTEILSIDPDADDSTDMDTIGDLLEQIEEIGEEFIQDQDFGMLDNYEADEQKHIKETAREIVKSADFKKWYAKGLKVFQSYHKKKGTWVKNKSPPKANSKSPPKSQPKACEAPTKTQGKAPKSQKSPKAPHGKAPKSAKAQGKAPKKPKTPVQPVEDPEPVTPKKKPPKKKPTAKKPAAKPAASKKKPTAKKPAAKPASSKQKKSTKKSPGTDCKNRSFTVCPKEHREYVEVLGRRHYLTKRKTKRKTKPKTKKVDKN